MNQQTKKPESMSFSTPWINSYNSLMKLKQDPVTGMLSGTYSSTTGGTGSYDVIGWASLQKATPTAGQTMAISILWRSNDGGKSDPSHEVSGMAGQVVFADSAEKLELLHLFVETNPATTPLLGFYPDKLIFVPDKAHENIITKSSTASEGSPTTIKENIIAGIWRGKNSDGVIEISFELPHAVATQLIGTILFPDGKKYPIAGFTDIYAVPPEFTRQGITFSTYVEGVDGRICVAIAGYLDLATNMIHLMELSAQSTDSGSTWYQTQLEQLILHRKAKPPIH